MPAHTTPSGRERFITIASELFSRRGFAPVALDEIIAASGVTKTTFYKHFESKDDLIVAVLAHRHAAEFGQLIQDIQTLAGPDPRQQILAIFTTFDQWFAESDFRGCIFINAANEFPQEHDPVHIAAVAHGVELNRMLREKCIAAGANARTADAVSAQILLPIMGSITARQATKHRDAARTAHAAASLILDTMLPGHPTIATDAAAAHA